VEQPGRRGVARESVAGAQLSRGVAGCDAASERDEATVARLEDLSRIESEPAQPG
jgi:hypothetical protein